MKTLASIFPLPPTESDFAGFTWPRYVATIPKGGIAKRKERYTRPCVGPYYHSPTPNQNGNRFFYLESDFMPGLRWKWCDEVEGVSIRHKGWFTNDFQDETLRGLVMRLPRSRGFLAGYSMGEGMASFLCPEIWQDEQDAAREADRMAERAAERVAEEWEREREREEEERAELEEAFNLGDEYVGKGLCGAEIILKPSPKLNPA